MGLITKLRLKRGINILRKNAEIIQSEWELISLSKASSIVLLYEISESTIPESIQQFAKSLVDENKKVYHVIYYTGNPKLLTLYTNFRQFVFTRKELSYCYLPPVSIINMLSEIDATYYIDINLTESFPLIYITALSNTRLKIGRESKLRLEYYNLLIDQKTEDQSDFLDHLIHYLKILTTTSND
ncbi:MAG TPA: hypothetical protein PK908_01500 [Bacteroidales bacterium]|nr:hypothetical protein [Bacteroidales bacterium]